MCEQKPESGFKESVSLSDNGTGNRIPRKKRDVDDLLISALAAGATYQSAAITAAVSPRTVKRRMAEPGFRARVSEAQTTLVKAALGTVADSMTSAAEKLRALLDAESETVQLSAARSLLEFGVKLRESVQVEERLANLETLLAENERKADAILQQA